MRKATECMMVPPDGGSCRWLPAGLNLSDWRQASAAPIFDDVPAEVMLETLQAGRLRCCEKNRQVFSPDNRPPAFLLVLQGRIKLFHLDRNGEERGLRFADPGELLCPPLNESDAALRYDTFAEAAEPLRLLILPAGFFLDMLRSHFPLARNLIAQLATSLERADRQACLRQARSAPVLVARYLLEHLPESDTSIDVRPVHLTAQELGIARETLSRAIAGMRDRRLIDYCRGKVRILDRCGLQELASHL